MKLYSPLAIVKEVMAYILTNEICFEALDKPEHWACREIIRTLANKAYLIQYYSLVLNAVYRINITENPLFSIFIYWS
jgi:hypothetical protein